MRSATVLLVGPNTLSRASLRRLFDGSRFAVVGEMADIAPPSAAAGGDALPSLSVVPDVVLVEMPDESAAVHGLLTRLKAAFPDTPSVVLYDKVSMAALAACLAAGASGFLTKDITPGVLLRSLELVIVGETVFPTDLAGLLAEGLRRRQRDRTPSLDAGGYGLSARENEILQHLLRGDPNKVIALRLNIAEATIKVHIKSVLRKINVTNRTQAAIWAHGRGYRPPDAEAWDDRPAF